MKEDEIKESMTERASLLTDAEKEHEGRREVRQALRKKSFKKAAAVKPKAKEEK